MTDAGGAPPRAPETLALRDRVVDLVRGDVVGRDGVAVRLTSREVALLTWLAQRPSQSIPRDTLLTEVWGYDESVMSRTVDTTVRRLRTKIESDPANPVHLLTEYGSGYRWEPGAATAPPPAPRRRTNVAASTEVMFGRADTVEALLAGAGRHPLHTLLGPAGVGKTRMAKVVASRWPGDAWFVDLCPITDAAGAVAALARAIDVGVAPDRGDPLRQLAGLLEATPGALLVLDNAEHVVAVVAAMVGTLRAASPSTRLLVTSRERLRVTDEHVVELGPLGLADGVALFRARAELVGVDVGDAPEIEAIVRRLDALPLAIELAAARVRVLPPPKLLERLNDRFRVLVGGRADGPAHQATLRLALDWSWDLLDADERRALTVISVFRGPFDVDAAEVVVGDAVAVLDRLVQRSLVVASRDGQLALLQNVREWASEKLAPDDPARERHRVWGLARAVELGRRGRGPGAIASLRELDAGIDDVRDAIARSWTVDASGAAAAVLAIDRLLLERGPAGLQLDLLERAIAAVPEDGRAMVLLRRARGELLRMVGRADDAITDLTWAMGRAEAHPDTAAAVGATLAMARIDRAELDEAEADGRAALARATARGDDASETAAYNAIGRVLVARGRLDAAAPIYREALDAALRSGDPLLEANMRGNYGNVLVHRGQLDEAGRHFRRGLDLHLRSGARRRVATLRLSIGNLALAQGDLPTAIAAYSESYTEYRALGVPLEAAMARGNLGCALCEAGRLDAAQQALEDALEEHRRIGLPARLIGIAAGNLGALRQMQGHLDEADALLSEAVERSRAVGDRRTAAYFGQQLATVQAEAGRLDRADTTLAEAVFSDDGVGDPALAALLELVTGFLAVARSRDPVDRQRWRDRVHAALEADGPAQRSAHLRMALKHLLHVTS